MTRDTHTIDKFRKTVYDYYEANGRHDLPWRHTPDPYHILVSEIMLQQTQVPRVIDKYNLFIARFGDVPTLAEAPVAAVIEAWQGLGYNRRALMLQNMAVEILERFDGEVPRSEPDLLSLPGIGPYTAAAVMAFAFDQPSIVIDTNIRSVIIHHFFPGRTDVPDSEIRPIVEAAIDNSSPRRWYSALMDYGAYLKSTGENPGRRSAHHVRQSPFEGSDRQIRGKVLRLLVDNGQMAYEELFETCAVPAERLQRILSGLCSEGFVEGNKGCYSITGGRTKSTNR